MVCGAQDSKIHASCDESNRSHLSVIVKNVNCFSNATVFKSKLCKNVPLIPNMPLLNQ